jgi:hypothetical protein
VTYPMQHSTADRTPIRGDEWVVCPAGTPSAYDGIKAPLAGIGLKGVISFGECGSSLRTDRAGPGAQ